MKSMIGLALLLALGVGACTKADQAGIDQAPSAPATTTPPADTTTPPPAPSEGGGQ